MPVKSLVWQPISGDLLPQTLARNGLEGPSPPKPFFARTLLLKHTLPNPRRYYHTPFSDPFAPVLPPPDEFGCIRPQP